MLKWTLLVSCVALWLTGCDVFFSDEPVPYADLDEVAVLQVQIDGTTVIRSRSEWDMFWQQHKHSGGPSAPEVDFERQVVLGVFYGGSLHAGCRSEVDVVAAVRRDGDALEVLVGPLPDLGPCRAVMHPLDVVVADVPAWEARTVRFIGRVP